MTETLIMTHAELTDRLAEVEQERDELAAMVGIMLTDASEHPTRDDISRTKQILAQSDGPAALRHIRAMAVEKAGKAINLRGFIRSNATNGIILEVKTQLQNYAQQLRSGGKA